MDKVTIARVYIMEEKGQLQKIIDYLHDEVQVRGVTVFRGIAGYGTSKHVHTASLVDLSLDLPLAVEFFDSEAKIAPVIKHLQTLVAPGHIVTWTANCY